MAALAAANVRRLNSLRSNSGDGRAQLPPDPDGEHHRRGGEQAEDRARGPAPVVALDDRQREAEEPGGDEADAGPVERRARAHAAAPNERQSQDDAQSADRDVEPEDGRPAPALDEQAAEDGSGGGGGRAERAEQAGREPLPSVRERLQQQSQRRRDHGRGAHRLHHAPGDERLHAPGARTTDGRGREHREAEHEQQLVAVAVGEPSHRQEEDGEHQVVAVHHPRDGDDRPLEPADDQRDGDAHHGRVGEREEDPWCQCEHDQPGVDRRARPAAVKQVSCVLRHAASLPEAPRVAAGRRFVVCRAAGRGEAGMSFKGVSLCRRLRWRHPRRHPRLTPPHGPFLRLLTTLVVG